MSIVWGWLGLKNLFDNKNLKVFIKREKLNLFLSEKLKKKHQMSTLKAEADFTLIDIAF